MLWDLIYSPVKLRSSSSSRVWECTQHTNYRSPQRCSPQSVTLQVQNPIKWNLYATKLELTYTKINTMKQKPFTPYTRKWSRTIPKLLRPTEGVCPLSHNQHCHWWSTLTLEAAAEVIQTHKNIFQGTVIHFITIQNFLLLNLAMLLFQLTDNSFLHSHNGPPNQKFHHHSIT